MTYPQYPNTPNGPHGQGRGWQAQPGGYGQQQGWTQQQYPGQQQYPTGFVGPPPPWNQQPGYGYQPPPPPPPKKPRFGLGARIGMIIGAVVVVGAIGNASNGGAENPRASTASRSATSIAPAAPLASTPAPAAPVAPPVPVGPLTTFGDGTYEVGRDVTAGSYSAPGGGNCYWARHEDSSGEFEAMITNEWKPDGGQVIVTARDGEFLEVSDCGTWTAR